MEERIADSPRLTQRIFVATLRVDPEGARPRALSPNKPTIRGGAVGMLFVGATRNGASGAEERRPHGAAAPAVEASPR